MGHWSGRFKRPCSAKGKGKTPGVGDGGTFMMNRQVVTSLLQRPVAFNPIFADITNSILAGLFLSQVFYWSSGRVPEFDSNGKSRDGWFYKTADECFEETRLTRHEQQTARKILTRLKLLEEKRKGIPSKLWFRLNWDVLLGLLEDSPPRRTKKTHSVSNQLRGENGKFVKKGENIQCAVARQPSVRQGRQQVSAADGNKHPPLADAITETTSKTTSKTTSSKKTASKAGVKKQQPDDPAGRSFYEKFGFSFAPYSNLLDENEAVRVAMLKKLDVTQIQRALGEFSSMSARGFSKSAADAWFWACHRQAGEGLVHTAIGDERLPSFE